MTTRDKRRNGDPSTVNSSRQAGSISPDRVSGGPKLGAHDQLHVIGGATEVAKQDMDVHMSFRVPSLADFVNRLDQMRVKYVNSKGEEREITVRPDGVKQVYFQDPDGYWIEVNDDKF